MQQCRSQLKFSGWGQNDCSLACCTIFGRAKGLQLVVIPNNSKLTHAFTIFLKISEGPIARSPWLRAWHFVIMRHNIIASTIRMKSRRKRFTCAMIFAFTARLGVERICTPFLYIVSLEKNFWRPWVWSAPD